MISQKSSIADKKMFYLGGCKHRDRQDLPKATLQPPRINHVIRRQQFPTSPPVDLKHGVKHSRSLETKPSVPNSLQSGVFLGFCAPGWNSG